MSISAWSATAAEDGNVGKHPSVAIARAVGWEGDPDELVSALIETGWFDRRDDGIYIHDFNDYAGRLNEKRKKDRERKNQLRERASSADTISDGIPSDVRWNSARTEQNTRETEHNTNTTQTEENKDTIQTEENRQTKDECAEADTRDIFKSSSQSVYALPLRDQAVYRITQQHVDRCEALFPDLDINAEIRKMVRWCELNPDRRTTRQNVSKFITNWFGRAQKDANSFQQALAGKASQFPDFPSRYENKQ